MSSERGEQLTCADLVLRWLACLLVDVADVDRAPHVFLHLLLVDRPTVQGAAPARLRVARACRASRAAAPELVFGTGSTGTSAAIGVTGVALLATTTAHH